MTPRRIAIATVVFGVATLAALISFSLLPEVQAVYPPGGLPPALSLFQRAETLADLAVVFGFPPNEGVIAAMHAVNLLDIWVFTPAYALFLVAAAFMIARDARGPLVWAAIVFALLGAGADVVETAAQLRVTADYANAEAVLPIAPWHWLKYGALALNGFAIGGLCLLRAPKRWILGAVALLPLPAVLAAYAGLIEPRIFSATFALYWIALLALALRDAVRKAA